MREIKFRAWDKKYITMYEVSLINFAIGEICIGFSLGVGQWRRLKTVDLMQYTGLKDKNGKEIYEGDIVHFMDFEFGNEGDGDEIQGTGQIKWDNVTASFFVTNRISAEMDDVFQSGEVEVIGNIYENVELLESEL